MFLINTHFIFFKMKYFFMCVKQKYNIKSKSYEAKKFK